MRRCLVGVVVVDQHRFEVRATMRRAQPSENPPLAGDPCKHGVANVGS
jgi:hypothetical protein